MTKSELIERLCAEQTHLSAKEIEDAVKDILEHMASTLESGDRIEIRGFGSFSLHFREPRVGRNPKTGDRKWSWKANSFLTSSQVKSYESASISARYL